MSYIARDTAKEITSDGFKTAKEIALLLKSPLSDSAEEREMLKKVEVHSKAVGLGVSEGVISHLVRPWNWWTYYRAQEKVEIAFMLKPALSDSAQEKEMSQQSFPEL